MNPPPELSPESLQKLDPAVVEEFLSDSISGIQMGQQDVMMAPDSAAFTVPAPQPTYNNGLCLEGYVAQQEIKGKAVLICTKLYVGTYRNRILSYHTSLEILNRFL